MGFATHLGPWLLGTTKDTTGTTADTTARTTTGMTGLQCYWRLGRPARPVSVISGQIEYINILYKLIQMQKKTHDKFY